jgi:hypothetical protein
MDGAQGPAGADGMDGAQGPAGADGMDGASGPEGPSGDGVGVPGRMGMIVDMVINDGAANALGMAKSVMVADKFDDDDPLTYTAAAMGALIGAVKQDPPGTFTVTIVDIDETNAAGGDDLDYPDNAMVTIVATDMNGLWTTQEFAVRRNRAPRDKDPIADDIGTVRLGITKETDSKRIHASDLFDDDLGDMLTLTPAVVLSDAVMAEVEDRAEYVMLKSAKVTDADGDMVRFSAVDSGGLPAPVEESITVHVHDGPRAVDDIITELRRPLGGDDEGLMIDWAELIKASAEGTTTFAAESSNEIIASVSVTNGADMFTLTVNSLGTAVISVTANQTGGDGPAQSLTIKFDVIVE